MKYFKRRVFSLCAVATVLLSNLKIENSNRNDRPLEVLYDSSDIRVIKVYNPVDEKYRVYLMKLYWNIEKKERLSFYEEKFDSVREYEFYLSSIDQVGVSLEGVYLTARKDDRIFIEQELFLNHDIFYQYINRKLRSVNIDNTYREEDFSSSFVSNYLRVKNGGEELKIEVYPLCSYYQDGMYTIDELEYMKEELSVKFNDLEYSLSLE